VAPAANPTWQGSDRDDVKAANQAALEALVKTEVTVAATKLTKLKTAMADTTKTELVGVDAASIDPPQAAAGKKARLALRYASPSPRRLRPGMPSHFDGVEMWV
jgi:hypothetical protein